MNELDKAYARIRDTITALSWKTEILSLLAKPRGGNYEGKPLRSYALISMLQTAETIKTIIKKALDQLTYIADLENQGAWEHKAGEEDTNKETDAHNIMGV